MMPNLKHRPIRLATSVLLISSLLTGCIAVGPDYETPARSEFDLERIDQIETGIRSADWWNNFDDALLTELIVATLENNYSLDAAKANVTAAYAVLKDVENDDQITSNLSAFYTKQDQQTFGFSDSRTKTKGAQGGLNLGFNLDLFGKIQRATESAMADAEAESFALLDLQVSLTAEAAKTYAAYLNSLMRISVAERNIDTLEQTREIVQAKVDEGFSPEFDLVRIDAELYGVKASVPALRGENERARQALIAITGGSFDLQADLQNTDRDINATYPDIEQAIAIGDPAELLSRRADLHTVERRVAAASARIGVRTADLYPDIQLNGFLGFVTNSSLTIDEDAKAWSITPTLTWTGFDQRSVRAQIKVANAEEEIALANFRSSVQQALYEAQVSISDYAQSTEQRRLLELQFEASTRALDIANQQYEEGVIDLLGLLDVRRTQLASEDSLVQAKSGMFVAMIDIYQAFGGGVSL